MRHHTSNSQLKVDGKMTPEGANKVGKLQAIALIILAVAVLLLAVSALIIVVK